MAVDKLVDSAQLNSDLTSVANAIRTKGGTSAQLAFPAGFVSAVEAIPTGGGGSAGDEFLWANTVEVVTVGANSAANTQACYNYFSAYTFKYLLLLSPLTEANQYVSWANGQPARYKNGVITGTSTGTNYDAKLVEGSQYLLLSD